MMREQKLKEEENNSFSKAGMENNRYATTNRLFKF